MSQHRDEQEQPNGSAYAIRHIPGPVAAGEVLIRKRIVNETVTIEVPVQREELLLESVRVESQPFDRPGAVAADALVQALSDRLRQMQPGEAVRVPVVEEEVIVHKQPLVRSEVVIGKRLVREIQHFLRHGTSGGRRGGARRAGPLC